ncbi:ABC transporter substrate-binding protein [Desertimonas flava]|uniref:ABC transporter substrate-binding protein n=1 Tax=Desertimonas flava TaxID=2064846 RepID=UPI000E3534DF|nr:ABC transporter substrate-binding protein [Desertimonas flava]
MVRGIRGSVLRRTALGIAAAAVVAGVPAIGGAARPATTATGACPEIDATLDEAGGLGAGRFMSDIQCTLDSPLAAEGDPVIIGFQNPEGDPNGSFPESSLAAQAAVDYINAELGGWGADIQNGVPGRPIQLEICRTAISPDDSQRCANELVAKSPELIVSTINFFGNHLPIFEAAGIPAVITSPVTIADFTSPSAYAIAGGGGCLGQHTALVEYATSDLGALRVGVPWADTPPGVVCYYDLEAKPLDVLSGAVPGDSERAGTLPDLEYLGVPIKPATPDVTPQVTEILGFEPDAIIFSAQGADCWNLVDGLGRLGWTPDAIPLVLSGACIDFDAMRAAGDLANGIYFVTAGGSVTNPPDTIEDPRERFEAETFQTKALEYGLSETDMFKGFGVSNFNSMIGVWELASRVVQGGEELTAESFATYVGATENDHMFGSTPLSCAAAPPPYVAVCNTLSTVAQWDGESLVPVREHFSGADLIAGTELRPGP